MSSALGRVCGPLADTSVPSPLSDPERTRTSQSQLSRDPSRPALVIIISICSRPDSDGS